MAVTKISKKGEEFIRSKINGTGTSYLSGSAKDKYGSVPDNPTKVLPFCNPLTNINDVWTSNPNINGGVRTNDELATALIKWYNKYAETFEMDANVMIAQAYQESGLKVWNYAVNSTACGITQFVDNTFLALIQNNRNRFSTAELQALTTGMYDYTYQPGVTPPKDRFLKTERLGKKNRAIIHQNIVDNPEIMIKAQFDYMDYIGTYCGDLASSTLFRYNRGLMTLKKTSSYTEVIEMAQSPKRSKDYEVEGINYVYAIFKLLYDNFGYKKLNITDEAKNNFDSFNASLG